MKAKPGEVPASTTPFAELSSDRTAEPWAKMGPTKVFGAEKGPMEPHVRFKTVKVAEAVVDERERLDG